MSEYGRAHDTSATPDMVWTIWSDPATWPAWNPDVESITLDGPFAAGTRGRMRTRSGGQHEITLAEVQPGHAFQLETSVLPLTRFAFRCEVTPAAGGSRISQSLRMRGPLAALFAPLAGNRIAASFGPLLDGLARYAEAQHAP